MRIISEAHSDAKKIAASLLNAGELIAFPTDTVYGLAADASNPKAIEKIYQIKGRNTNKPIAILLPSLSMAEKIFVFDSVSKEIAKKFLPGKVTLVLKTKEHDVILAKNLNEKNDNFIGFRIIDSIFIKSLFSCFNKPIALTSANKSGQDAAKSCREVEKYFTDSMLSLIVEGDCNANALASTVVKIENKKLTILRQGEVIIQNSN